MDIKNQIQRIIDKRRQKLIKEIDEYETKMRETESNKAHQDYGICIWLRKMWNGMHDDKSTF